MAGEYEFDKSSFSFKKARVTLGKVLWVFAKYLALSILLAIVYYLLFSLVISTDTERKLRRENRMYEKIYPQMQEREQMLSDVISGLQVKDNDIYEEIFHTDAPSMNPVNSMGFIAGSDSIPDRKLLEYTSKKADNLLDRSAVVEKNLLDFFSVVGASLPPLTMPIKDASYVQMGASVGRKVNPFYKVEVMHNGLDIVASQGTPVLAAADGTVTSVSISRKGLGNVVEVSHKGGYVTNYCHLADIRVKKGQSVKRGQHLGDVGMSGNTYAPHLHYEVLRGGEYVDPVNYFFASVDPEEYMNMIVISGSTGQSMD